MCSLRRLICKLEVQTCSLLDILSFFPSVLMGTVSKTKQNAGNNLGLTNIHGMPGGSSNTPICFILQKLQLCPW